ncbi:MAG: hypothetical protein R8G01_12545 [Ilumatobacteraceae bacterium]|nr:hypothetical protein [Ilumatobacteraceae bacterium]
MPGTLRSRSNGRLRRGCRLAGLFGLAAASLGCSGTDDTPASAGFVAQCLGVSDGALVGAANVCHVDEHGKVVEVSDVELAQGLPYVVDSHSNQITAVARSGELVDISGAEARFLADADGSTAYGFTSESQLVGLTSDGEFRSADGVLLSEFGVDGVVDVRSGIDIHGGEVVFTVERASGGFAVAIGDLSSGDVAEITRSDVFVGQARWSPDGSRLSFVGPDYRSIEVVDRGGDLVASFTPLDRRLSGRFNAPRWIDDDTIVFFDAVPALVEGDVRTGDVEVMSVFDLESGIDAVPVLPVPA